MAIDSRQRRKYQSGGYVGAALSPYQYALDLAGLDYEREKSKGQQAITGAETTKKIGQMKELFSAKKEEATEKAESKMEGALEKAEKARKKAQKKSGRFGGIFKGLNLLSMFMGPLGAALTAGITGGLQGAIQKDAMKGLGGSMKELSKYMDKSKIDLGGSWRGRTKGLSWLSEPTKQIEKNIGKYLKTGSSSFSEGSKEAYSAARGVNPLANALTSAATAFIMKKAMGSEGVFGGKGDITTTVGGEIPLAEQTAISTKLGADVNQLGLMPETTIMPSTLGGKLQKQFLTGDKGKILEPGSDEYRNRLLALMPMFTSILGDTGLEIPEIDTEAGYVSQY